PILCAKRRRLRFQGIPEFFRCAPPRTVARARTDFSRITGKPSLTRLGKSYTPTVGRVVEALVSTCNVRDWAKVVLMLCSPIRWNQMRGHNQAASRLGFLACYGIPECRADRSFDP